MPVASFIICAIELVSAGRVVVLIGLGELVVFFGFRVAAQSFAGFPQAEPGGAEGGLSLGGAAIEIVRSGEILLRELHPAEQVESLGEPGFFARKGSSAAALSGNRPSFRSSSARFRTAGV